PAQGAARMRTGEILAAEAAGLETGDGNGVAQYQRRGGAGGGGQVQRAGLLRNMRVQVQVGAAGQFGLRIAGNGNQSGTHALYDRQYRQKFMRRAGIGDGQHDVLARQHAQIAMYRLGAVHEEGGRAGGGQRGGDLLGDVSGLSYARNDDAPLAAKHHGHGPLERIVQAGVQGLQSGDLGGEAAVGR